MRVGGNSGCGGVGEGEGEMGGIRSWVCEKYMKWV